MTDQHPGRDRTEQSVGWTLHAPEPDEELAEPGRAAPATPTDVVASGRMRA